jgi:spore germination cell wall hydrolase CwlJ-like protein
MLIHKKCERCGADTTPVEDGNFCSTCQHFDWVGRSQFNVIIAFSLVIILLALASFPNVANASTSDEYFMTEAIYFESRDQILAGQIAVGCVIKKRMETDMYHWGSTAREVVHQRKQFSYWSDGKPEIYTEPTAHYIANMMAKHVLESNTCDFYGNIDHFINHDIAHPSADWFSRMKFVMKIGQHSFYESIKS